MPASEPLLPAALEIEIPCRLEHVRTAALKLRSFLATNRCVDSDVRDCELALVEACNNAIEHALGEARSVPVRIEALCRPAMIELRITDHTGGFSWPAAAALPTADAESGRGVYVIQALMDASEYHRLPGRNVLVLRRTRR